MDEGLVNNEFSLVKLDTPYFKDWDAFAEKYGSIFHSTKFKTLLERTFSYDTIYYFLTNSQGSIVAILPFVLSRDLSVKKAAIALPFINYLDICHSDEVQITQVLPYLTHIQKIHRLDYLQIRTTKDIAFGDNFMDVSNNYVFYIPINIDDKDILALSTSDNRNHTRKVLKKNKFNVQFETEHLPEFYKVYRKRMHQLGSPCPDIIFFENFFNIFPDNVTLLTVWDEQTKSLVGGMLLVADFNRKILYYPYGSCLVEYNKHYVNNFMYWQAVQRGKFLKMDYLDLGRSPVDSGTYRYKKHWGAQPIQLHYINFAAGKSLHLPSKDNMGIFIRIWQKMPAIAVNFIGKNIIKYVLP